MSDKGEMVALETMRGAWRPESLKEMIEFAELISESDMIPKGYHDKPANVVVAVQFGAEVGLRPMQSLQGIAVINGKPGLYGDSLLGVVQAHPDYEWHKEYFEGEAGTDEFRAICIVKRRGHDQHSETFSIGEAKQAKLWEKRGKNGQDTPWITFPTRMLKMRARAFALRDIFADALQGLGQTAEELQDQDVIDVEPELADGTHKTGRGKVADPEPPKDPTQGADFHEGGAVRPARPTDSPVKQAVEPPPMPTEPLEPQRVDKKDTPVTELSCDEVCEKFRGATGKADLKLLKHYGKGLRTADERERARKVYEMSLTKLNAAGGSAFGFRGDK